MNSAKINDWLQVVGLFGVIGSLIFVGLQMKQDQEIARSAAYQARSEQVTALIAEMASIPSLRSGFQKLQTDGLAEMTADEFSAVSMFSAAMFITYENIHYQYTSGFIDDEHWKKSRFGLKNFLRFDGNRDAFRTNFSGWRDSFRVLVEALIAEIDAEDDQ